MSTLVRVQADDLQIGDRVKDRGHVIRDVVDHETREDFVTVVFERKGGIEVVEILPAKLKLSVRCSDDD